MNSLENVRALILDYLKISSACESESQNRLVMNATAGFKQKVFDAFFNLIADTSQSPENRIHQLATYTSGLENGLFTNKCLQILIAFACFEALARNRPEVLNGDWEILAWIIVDYLAYPNMQMASRLLKFKKTDIATLNSITEFISVTFCPNPFLTLEIIKFMNIFNCKDMTYDRNLFRENIINTLFELSDNYTSFTLDQNPYFSPIDLEFVINEYNINIEYIINDYNLNLKKSEIIAAVLKLTRNLALLEKEKHLRFVNRIGHIYTAGFNQELFACLSFCGLIQPYDYTENDFDQSLQRLIKAVSNDALLMNNVIHTIETITYVSLCATDYIQQSIKFKVDSLLHKFFKTYIKQLPKFQYLQEINGGYTKSLEYRIRYLQNNYDSEKYNSTESDNDN